MCGSEGPSVSLCYIYSVNYSYIPQSKVLVSKHMEQGDTGKIQRKEMSNWFVIQDLNLMCHSYPYRAQQVSVLLHQKHLENANLGTDYS